MFIFFSDNQQLQTNIFSMGICTNLFGVSTAAWMHMSDSQGSLKILKAWQFPLASKSRMKSFVAIKNYYEMDYFVMAFTFIIMLVDKSLNGIQGC